MYRYDAIAISMHVCVVDGGKISKISATGEAKNYMKYRCTEFRYASEGDGIMSYGEQQKKKSKR